MRRDHQNPLASRRAFTLLEVMLVMAILVAVAAVAWPQIHRAYDTVRLRKAADHVQEALSRARVQAMSSGLPQVFRFEPNSPRYTITPVQDETESLDASAADTSASAASATLTASSAGNQADSTNPCEHQLPDGFMFSSAQRSSDTRSSVAEGQLNDATVSSDAPPVFFYADGSSQDAVITISNDNGRSISITLRGYTGITRIGEIFASEGAAK